MSWAPRSLGVAAALLLVACNAGTARVEPDTSSVLSTTTDASAAGDPTSTAPVEAAQLEGPSLTMTDRLDLDSPVNVIATQGPIDEESGYVLVTWDHAVRSASSYEVARDGRSIGTVTIDDRPWDDTSWRDPSVPSGIHRYEVRAIVGNEIGPWSEPAEVEVRGSVDIGAVFRVDDFDGSDLRRAQQAVDAAADAGGGIVQFGVGDYVFDDPLVIYGDGVLLRGAGESLTNLRVGFPGGDDSCGRVTPLVLFQSGLTPLDSVLAEPAPSGSTTMTFASRPAVSPGDVVSIDGVVGQLTSWDSAERGIAQDPTIPNDERYPFDYGRVVSVTGNTIEIDHPVTQGLTVGSALARFDFGIGNGMELLTVSGISADDTSYQRLIDARDQVDFRVADVTVQWANRTMLDASGYGITLIGLTSIDGGAGGYELEACKYKVGLGPATDVVIVGSTFGSQEHDLNMSLLTLQFVYRAMIRNSTFGGSRTYGFNEHGGGSRLLVFENNFVASGPNSWSGVLLGNDTWGFGGETAIRNNEFAGNIIDVLMVENPYGISIVGNHSSGCSDVCITWAGWGGEHDGYQPIPDPTAWGSAKLLVAANVIIDAEAGIRLGADDSGAFRYIGVRDVVVFGNDIQSSGPGLTVLGDAASSGRLWVADNRFGGGIETGTPGDDWWFWDNDTGPAIGSSPLPDWAQPYQEWER